jgi:4-hydroxybenzoate polyprenyltransferase
MLVQNDQLEVTIPPTRRLSVQLPRWRQELKLNWRFIRRDITVTLIPGLLFTIAAILQQSSQPQAIDGVAVFNAVSKILVFEWFCITAFCISNQIVSLDEDRMNKPDRPLVSGLLTYEGAIFRLIAASVGLMFFSSLWGVGLWAGLWLGCTALYNQAKWSSNWFWKSVLVAVLMLAELAAAWQIIMPITSFAWAWIALVVTAWTFVGHLQDMRDIEGDAATGRKTLPILLGESVTRWQICLGFLTLPIASHLLMQWANASIANLILWDVILAILCGAIAWRILKRRSAAADHKTYMIFTYWYCAVTASAACLPLF